MNFALSLNVHRANEDRNKLGKTIIIDRSIVYLLYIVRKLKLSHYQSTFTDNLTDLLTYLEISFWSLPCCLHAKLKPKSLAHKSKWNKENQTNSSIHDFSIFVFSINGFTFLDHIYWSQTCTVIVLLSTS